MFCCSCSKSRRPFAAYLAIVVGIVVACTVHAKKVESRATANLSFPAAGMANLKVETHNGDIVCRPSDPAATEILATVEKTGAGKDEADAEACLNAIEIVAKQEGDALSLSWKWNVASPPDRWQASVSFDIVGPASLYVDANSHNGTIHVDKADNGATLETHNGDVTIGYVSGKLVAKSYNGDVVAGGGPSEVELTLHNGDLLGQFGESASLSGAVQNHNGDVQLVFGPNVSTEATCGTSLGELIAGGDGIVVTKRGDASLVATVGADPSPAGKLSVNTHNGDVALMRMR